MKIFLFLIAQLVAFVTYAQDTLFVRTLPIDSIVQNIDTDGSSLFLRLKGGLYKWDRNKLSFIERGGFKYTWIDYDPGTQKNYITHNNIIDPGMKESASKMDYLIPGKYNFNTSLAVLGNKIYLCYNGKVLEYEIKPEFLRYYKGNSIRHVYSEPGFRVVSTYKGVYVNNVFLKFDEVKMHDNLTNYSNGEFVKIDSSYFLCQDNLLEYNRVDGTIEVLINTENEHRFRNLIQFNNKTFGLFDGAFGEVNLKKGEVKKPYLFEDELSDVLEYKDKLFVSSNSSLLYEMNMSGEIKTYDAPGPINDLVVINDKLNLGCDTGLFRFEDSNFVTIIPEVEVIQALSFEDKIIFSNSSGLFYSSNGMIQPFLENIEFNKSALSIDYHFLYAGSTIGLFVIQTSVLSGLTTTGKIEIKKSNSYLVVVIVLITSFAILIFALLLKQRQLRKKLNKKKGVRRSEIDSYFLREVLMSNPEIKSVEHLANAVGTNVTQLNRYLKKENLTGLVLLKNIKKEIVVSMWENGNSLDDIANRVGYSKRYIRKNFLSSI